MIAHYPDFQKSITKFRILATTYLQFLLYKIVVEILKLSLLHSRHQILVFECYLLNTHVWYQLNVINFT